MKKQAIISKIKQFSQSELIALNNQYCEDINAMDDQIFENDDEFFELFFEKSIDAIRAVNFGDYRYSDNYVRFNGYGNLESFSYMTIDILPDLVENVADVVYDNFENYNFLF